MTLKLHNTRLGRKEVFNALVPGKVGMYVCGVTLYDDCHLGHARSALVFDVIRNYLQFSGYRVTFVKNFTDVDDKIINRAAQEGTTWTEIVDRYLRAYRRDMGRLGVPAADIEPKATEHILDIVDLIQALLEKEHAYRLDGDVYYAVESYPPYGALSGRKPEDLLMGARVEVNDRKRNPMDFVLWKASKPGEPAWKSPWGFGRPGWHIECSAMSMRHLGETFDIHGGGMDLIFPHHENEVAQSCAATGKEFARYWIHNGFVQVNQEKMSKSLGNFFTIREVFEQWGYREPVTAEALRYFLLGTHYRSPLDFTDHALHEAKRALDGIYGLFQRLEEPSPAQGAADPQLKISTERLEEGFRQAMEDDFNTPAAIATFQTLRGEINSLLGKGLSRSARVEALSTFRRLGAVLRLFQLSFKDWEFAEKIIGTGHQLQSAMVSATGHAGAFTDAEIEHQLEQRNEARRRKDFARADQIRAALADQGITIEDRPDGTSRWKR
jgi:cysteinyl-tRNA synthetase